MRKYNVVITPGVSNIDDIIATVSPDNQYNIILMTDNNALIIGDVVTCPVHHDVIVYTYNGWYGDWGIGLKHFRVNTYCDKCFGPITVDIQRG